MTEVVKKYKNKCLLYGLMVKNKVENRCFYPKTTFLGLEI